MIIVCNNKEYAYLTHNCDGRCAEGDWCIFADGTDNGLCPLEMNDITIVEENKRGFLEKGVC